MENVVYRAVGWKTGIRQTGWIGRHRQMGQIERHLHLWRLSLFDAIARAVTSAEPGAQALEALFDTLFARLERSVYGYLWRVLGDRQAAEDLTQETFLRTWRHIDKISGYEQPETWVWRVATNLALNERRRLTTWNLQPLDNTAESLGASDPAMRIAVHDQVHATLLALSPRLRAAITLREVYGLSFTEIAQALNISPANARVTLSRAREQFRQRYQRTEGAQ